jgi:hypothetical protein
MGREHRHTTGSDINIEETWLKTEMISVVSLLLIAIYLYAY